MLLVGTDQRIISAAVRTAAFRGGIHGCTRTIRGNVRFFSLAPRAPSIHGIGLPKGQVCIHGEYWRVSRPTVGGLSTAAHNSTGLRTTHRYALLRYGRCPHSAECSRRVRLSMSPVLQYENARTVLAVLLLREKDLVGVVSIWRREVQLAPQGMPLGFGGNSAA
jgi:hypothetical protein